MNAHRTGIDLARAYWADVVRPILDEHAPGIPRAAARIGAGSDVLGLADAMSRDHDWGLRLQVVVAPEHREAVHTLLAERLPREYAGLPTRFAFTGEEQPRLALDVPSVDDLVATLGFDPRRGGSATDWLSLTGQAVLEVVAGEVFEDSAGELTSLREALRWYPDDVWRHIIACDWQRLDQELPLLARAGDRGDDLGSRVIAARLVGVTLHLGFMLSRAWPPYPKWRGTAFARLPLPASVGEHLAATLAATGWRERTDHLAAALDDLAAVQGAAGMPAPTPACVPFWDRPYLHLDHSLIPGLLATIDDPEVRALPVGLGSIEQRSDAVDLLVDVRHRRAALGLT